MLPIKKAEFIFFMVQRMTFSTLITHISTKSPVKLTLNGQNIVDTEYLISNFQCTDVK